MSFGELIPNCWTHWGNISQAISSEKEGEEEKRNLYQEGSSPSITVYGSDHCQVESGALVSIPVTDKSAQWTAHAHTELYGGVRPYLLSKETTHTAMNMLAIP